LSDGNFLGSGETDMNRFGLHQNHKNHTLYGGQTPQGLSEVLGKQMCQNVPGTTFEKVPDSNFLNYKNKKGPVKIPEVLCHYLNNPKYF
jgi:hypothetical protein